MQTKKAGRPLGAKNRPRIGSGSRFKQYEGARPTDKHVRLTRSMMLSPVYMELSSSAKELYSYMKLWACGNTEVEYAASMSNKYMSKNTFFKARDELIDNGFIEYPNRHCARDKREVARYEFSAKWLNKANSST